MNSEMLQDVSQSFSRLQAIDPRIQANLEKCFIEIEAKYSGENAKQPIGIWLLRIPCLASKTHFCDTKMSRKQTECYATISHTKK